MSEPVFAVEVIQNDEKNESRDQLDAGMRTCDGVFSCDCPGVGTDWKVGELRRACTAPLAAVGIVPDPAGLAGDFAAMMKNAMDKQVPDVPLGLATLRHVSVPFPEQVAAAAKDLAGRRAGPGPRQAWRRS